MILGRLIQIAEKFTLLMCDIEIRHKKEEFPYFIRVGRSINIPFHNVKVFDVKTGNLLIGVPDIGDERLDKLRRKYRVNLNSKDWSIRNCDVAMLDSYMRTLNELWEELESDTRKILEKKLKEKKHEAQTD